MNREKDIIHLISKLLPRSADQINKCFESDSEILRHGSEFLLFTVDEFSNEDLFRDNDPYTLGWNLAVGTLSDILASGGDPIYYAHSLSVDKDRWDERYLGSFSKGIADVIKISEAGFIGGDTGTSESWHYTGIALGTAKKPVTRIGTAPGESLYLSGKIGAGNLEAGLKHFSKNPALNRLARNYKTQLNFRGKESKLIRNYATTCIDTSDGLLNSLLTISELNSTGFNIDYLPFISQGIIACKLLSKSILCLFAGECGEYELLFSVKKQDEPRLLAEAKEKGYKFYRLGEVTNKESRSVKFNDSFIEFNDFEISARDFDSLNNYLDKLEDYLLWKTTGG